MPLSVLTQIFGILLISINVMDGQSTYQSLMLASTPGLQYSPADLSIQLIYSSVQLSFKACATACHNNPFCRIFDYGADGTEQCRLFEGDLGVMGSLVSSPSSSSVVGSVQLSHSLFTQYGQACSAVCGDARYLVCNTNSKCECWPHFYWSAAMGICLAQVSVLGASCVPGVNMCRGDLNLSCSTTLDQCRLPGPLFPLVGITVANNNTPIQGSPSNGVQSPLGILVYDGSAGESLIVVDSTVNAVLEVSNVLSSNRNMSLLLNTWPTGEQFNSPGFVVLDRYNHSNLYVSDTNNDRVMLFSSMQAVSPVPQVVAGVSRTPGSSPDKFFRPNGMALDNQSNLYVADMYNNRVMFWPVNATSGILIAGTGGAGSSSWQLWNPTGLFLNEQNTLLYVADTANHRVQLFCLTGTPPYNGTTVAGGNGYGSNNNQLFAPYDLWVSETSGNIYVADYDNHRIQRWSPNATIGVTVAGDSSALAGSDATRLMLPTALTINTDETRMYVSDSGNKRIQRFDLV